MDYKNAAKKEYLLLQQGARGSSPPLHDGFIDTIYYCVPIKLIDPIDGWDSVLSILQMPSGIPCFVALNGAKNAGILAVKILYT